MSIFLLLHPCLFHSTIPAQYLITGIAQVFMVFTIYPTLSFGMSIAHIFLCILSWYCFLFHFVNNVSSCPRYLCPVSSMPLVLLLSGSCIALVLVTLPFSMLIRTNFLPSGLVHLSPGCLTKNLDVIHDHQVVNSAASFLELVPNFHPLPYFCHGNYLVYYKEQWEKRVPLESPSPDVDLC